MDTNVTPTKSETEIDTPPHITHPLSSLKNHHHHHLRHRDDTVPAAEVTYGGCMKNHAAAIGGHALDGCGEFMLSPQTFTAADPTSLTCAACGCHRNFHRRDPESPTSAAITPPFLDFRHPPPPKRFSLSLSPSPSPSSPPVPFPPHVFFSAAAEDHHQAPVTPTVENPLGRKRFRTKFSQIQKEKMHSFSVKLGWKMQKCDETSVKEFCREIGVSKGVLKVWMHNNKNTFGKREIFSCGGGGGIANGRPISFETTNGGVDGRKIRNGNNFEIENGNGEYLHGGSS